MNAGPAIQIKHISQALKKKLNQTLTIHITNTHLPQKEIGQPVRTLLFLISKS